MLRIIGNLKITENIRGSLIYDFDITDCYAFFILLTIGNH